ncbi:hypothetical protein [Streptomyces sp. NPDC006355]|uniref:hypothetical protein n=1 Tax=Streptomyces sp. NPDC006355 TaxID=3156758 RepID=UPI0033BBC351
MATTPPTVTVDLAADLTVIRPGDTLLVRMPSNAPLVQLEMVANRLRDRLPDVEVLVIAAEGVDVYRPNGE